MILSEYCPIYLHQLWMLSHFSCSKSFFMSDWVNLLTDIVTNAILDQFTIRSVDTKLDLCWRDVAFWATISHLFYPFLMQRIKALISLVKLSSKFLIRNQLGFFKWQFRPIWSLLSPLKAYMVVLLIDVILLPFFIKI